MAPRPIFTITHPRACSTAFERVFMTRRDELASQHEPFGDAYYFGPECVSERFKDDPARREESGVSDATFKSVLEGFDEVARQVRFLSYANLCSSAGVSDFIVVGGGA
ncbi:hypothetical protein E5D57_002404 [Metarhizium anisopliae]|nr:hypothetical protein E5D57_002404 [Metarhizium anisopliae]